MAEPAWTPGPWSLPHFAAPNVNCQCGYVLTDNYMGAVCTVHASGEGDDWRGHGDNPRFAEAVANARLIAASPTMADYVRRKAADGDTEAAAIMETIHARS